MCQSTPSTSQSACPSQKGLPDQAGAVQVQPPSVLSKCRMRVIVSCQSQVKWRLHRTCQKLWRGNCPSTGKTYPDKTEVADASYPNVEVFIAQMSSWITFPTYGMKRKRERRQEPELLLPNLRGFVTVLPANWLVIILWKEKYEKNRSSETVNIKGLLHWTCRNFQDYRNTVRIYV